MTATLKVRSMCNLVLTMHIVSTIDADSGSKAYERHPGAAKSR